MNRKQYQHDYYLKNKPRISKAKSLRAKAHPELGRARQRRFRNAWKNP
jgi:hypothetical protein